MILIKGRTYDVLKFIAMLVLPALGTLYFTLAAIWGLPGAEKVVNTIIAVDAFLGAILQLSSSAYKHSEDRYDGDLVVSDKPGGGQLHTLELREGTEIGQIQKKDELRFKVQKVQEVKKRVGGSSRRKHSV